MAGNDVWAAHDETAPASKRVSAAERAVAWALPSLADAIFALCLLGVVFVLQGKALGQDGDIGWHIQLGLHTLAGKLPRADFFSYTAFGRPLVGVEWLAEACYAAVWRLAGLNGVVVLAGVLIAATSAGLLIALRARGTPLLLALPLALLAIALTSIHWSSRPHLFSFPLTLWWSEWLWRYWRDGQQRRLWVFPLVMALWVNLHTGFFSGLVLLGTAVVVAWLFPRSHGKARPRALTVTFVACVLATFVNPWGWSWIGYFAAYFTDPLVVANTQELQSPDFHTLVGRIFLALLLLLVSSWVLNKRDQSQTSAARPGERTDSGHSAPTTLATPSVLTGGPEPLAWATAGIWTILALNAIRGVPLWALVVTPILAESLTAWLRSSTRQDGGPRVARMLRATWERSRRLDTTERRVGRGIWSAIALIFTLAVVLDAGRLPFTSQTAVSATFPAAVFPVEAVARLKAGGVPPGHGFSTIQWGGYLEYALPQNRVFIDSHADFYGPEILSDYLDMVDVGPGWQATLDRYQIAWTLLPNDIPLTQVLRTSNTWSCQPMDASNLAVLCMRIQPLGGDESVYHSLQNQGSNLAVASHER